MTRPDRALPPARRAGRPCRGLTLVEMMVGMVLGLLLVIGVLGMYITQGQAYRTTDHFARMQENARFALERLLREVRDSAQRPCGSRLQANVLRQPGAQGRPAMVWWADTEAGMVRGFAGDEPATGIVATGGGRAQRVDGTEALLLLRVSEEDPLRARILDHDPATQTLTLASTAHLRPAQIVLACDGQGAALFQLASVTHAARTAGYAGAALNCSTDLGGADLACQATVAKTFRHPAQLVRWDPGLWFIGVSPGGGSSLYRRGLVLADSGPPAVDAQSVEVAPGVSQLRVEYLTRDPLQGGLPAERWVDAASLRGAWNQENRQVVAVRITLTLRSEAAVGSEAQPLRRDVVAVASLRNRD